MKLQVRKRTLPVAVLPTAPYSLVIVFCLQECESDPCCEGSSCKLKSFAECAYGDCCKDCQARNSPCQGQIREGKLIMEMRPPRSPHTTFVICSLYMHPTSVRVIFCKGSIELVCVFGGLGIKYKALCLLGKHSTDKL